MKIEYSRQKVVKMILIISILLISVLILFALYKANIFQIVRNRINDAKKEVIGTKAQYEIMAENGENYEILITIENSNGIERITSEDITIEGNGKQKIALDRMLKEGQEYQIRIKPIGETEELYTLVASKKPNIVITNIDTTGNGSTKTVNIEYPNNENLINYYSLDDGATWSEYTNELNILEVDNKTIAAKSEWKEGKTIENVAEKLSLVISDSLLSATKNAIMKNDTHYRIAVKDEEYTVHTYIENEDLILEENRMYGNESDVGKANEDAKYMVIVKVNGNLTINNRSTLTAYKNNYGGPKGMLLYVTGNLENSGEITMTARGAKAEGQNVYMWKNQNTTNAEYEFIPKEGANGANGIESKNTKGEHGINGTNGENRQTGGGGSGGAHYYSRNNVTVFSGNGASGTSYSGGTGGGGSYCTYNRRIYGKTLLFECTRVSRREKWRSRRIRISRYSYGIYNICWTRGRKSRRDKWNRWNINYICTKF